MTHPFHPWSGREFLFLSVGHNWGEDRVFFLDDDGVKHSLPLGWTDAASVDVFVALATGRSPFASTTSSCWRIWWCGCLELPTKTCKVNYAGDVR